MRKSTTHVAVVLAAVVFIYWAVLVPVTCVGVAEKFGISACFHPIYWRETLGNFGVWIAGWLAFIVIALIVGWVRKFFFRHAES